MRTLIVALSLLLFSVNAMSQTTYGSWLVGKIEGGEGDYAATVNDSRSAFGQYCYVEANACIWLLAFDVNCTPDNKYPVLVNSDGGSEQLLLVCSKYGANKSRYVFTDFDKVSAVMAASKKFIGFAFPLDGGLFEVSRFLLDGADEAIKRMRSNFSANRGSGKSQGTRNYRM